MTSLVIQREVKWWEHFKWASGFT